MTGKIKLSGIGWDHRRCMAPLHASVSEYTHNHPELDIQWSTRNLAHFGEGNFEELLDHDLIVFDHPYCGDIAKNGWLISLSNYLSEEEFSEFREDSLGPCWESYQAEDQVWGLPIDAAAQVASFRPDLLEKLHAQVPKTLPQVLELAKHARTLDMWVAFPACPIDAICTFLTLSANDFNPVSSDKSYFPDKKAVIEYLTVMKSLVDVSYPPSRNWNPIKCYDHMSTTDDICYIPFAFGYINYSRNSPERPIQFCDIPGLLTTNCQGALLGGAGIGVSSRSKHPEAAVEYAKFLCRPDYQSGNYVINEGQPASLSAWETQENNESSMNFFSGTIQTLQKSYLRPRFRGYIRHFREGGREIAAFLEGKSSADSVAEWLIEDYFR